jgi:16S rRNA (cytosine967-C5)-methyltransferase
MQLPSLLGHVQELLGTILTSDKPADSLIDRFFRSRSYLGSHDRRFIAETTYGTLRHLRRSQAALTSSLPSWNEPLGEHDLLVLTIAAYLVNVERSPALSPEIVASILQSSQLRRNLPRLLETIAAYQPSATNAVERIGLAYSFPQWMVERFLREFGENESEQLCASLNHQAPLTLRVNTLKTSVEDCRQSLQREGVETTRTMFSPVGLNVGKRFNIFSLNAFRDGLFEVQDEGSQLLALLIDPKPTAKVLDVCAGAGGKTLALAAIMKNRGEIFAADVHDGRLKELRKRSKRAGVSNVRVKSIGAVEELSREFAGSFDVVLVDAPCSGLGTIRRNPGMKWTVTEETVRELSQRQGQIVESSSTLVKPGGRLFYSTCTLLREENEDVVQQFVSRHAEFTLMDLSLEASKFHLSSAVTNGYLKLLPHRHGTDGFFFALMQKVL